MARVIVVLDASVLIAYLDNGVHFASAVQLLRDAADVGDSLAMSSVTLAEVLVGPVRHGTEKLGLDAIAGLGIVEAGSPPDAALALARLRARTELKLPDCCVLLAAQTSHAAVASFDGRLLAAAAAINVPIRTA